MNVVQPPALQSANPRVQCPNPVRRTLVCLLLVLALIAAACGGDDPEGGVLTPLGFDDVDEDVDPVIRAVPATEAPAPATIAEASVASTDAPAVTKAEPGTTWVAVARPEIGQLFTFDAPNGEPVHFEFDLYNPTYWETPLALRIVEGTGADEWVKVALPVRPNGSEAWIRTEGFDISTHNVEAEIEVETRTVRVFDDGELIAETSAVVGKAATPTPLGVFYVNDLLPRDNPNGAFGPWILSLSGFSETLDTFGGGLPVIAIHGTNNPGLVGGAHSNGCIRIPNDVITFLAENVPLGTPVTIY